jgi:hypothetical protein
MTNAQFDHLIEEIKKISEAADCFCLDESNANTVGSKVANTKKANKFRQTASQVIARTDPKELKDRIRRENKNTSVVASAIDVAIAPVRAVAGAIKGAFDTLTGFIGGIFSVLPFGGLLKGAAVIGGMIVGWQQLQPFLEKPEIKNWFSNFSANFINVVNSIIKWFVKTFTSEEIGEDFDIRKWTQGKIDSVLNGRSVGEYLVDLVTDIIFNISKWIMGEDEVDREAIKEKVKGAIDGIVKFASNIGELFNGVIETMTNMLSSSERMLNSIEYFIIGMKKTAGDLVPFKKTKEEAIAKEDMMNFISTPQRRQEFKDRFNSIYAGPMERSGVMQVLEDIEKGEGGIDDLKQAKRMVDTFVRIEQFEKTGEYVRLLQRRDTDDSITQEQLDRAYRAKEAAQSLLNLREKSDMTDAERAKALEIAKTHYGKDAKESRETYGTVQDNSLGTYLSDPLNIKEPGMYDWQFRHVTDGDKKPTKKSEQPPVTAWAMAIPGGPGPGTSDIRPPSVTNVGAGETTGGSRPPKETAKPTEPVRKSTNAVLPNERGSEEAQENKRQSGAPMTQKPEKLINETQSLPESVKNIQNFLKKNQKPEEPEKNPPNAQIVPENRDVLDRISKAEEPEKNPPNAQIVPENRDVLAKINKADSLVVNKAGEQEKKSTNARIVPQNNAVLSSIRNAEEQGNTPPITQTGELAEKVSSTNAEAKQLLDNIETAQRRNELAMQKQSKEEKESKDRLDAQIVAAVSSNNINNAEAIATFKRMLKELQTQTKAIKKPIGTHSTGYDAFDPSVYQGVQGLGGMRG